MTSACSNHPTVIRKAPARGTYANKLVKLFCASSILLSSLPLAALATPVAAPSSDKDEQIASASGIVGSTTGDTDKKPLQGKVTQDDTPYPFKADHSTETIPEGTTLNLTVNANLNSELNQVGDEITAEVSTDIKDGNKILLPGKWKVVGKVIRVEQVKRLGRDGFMEIQFEKLVSPDGKWMVPLHASASTKESTVKTVTKQVVTTAGYTTVGAIGGSILSVQLTGLPMAVATHGISVGIGAAVGATLGIAAAAHRKGNILNAIPGDEIKIRLPGAITLPAFNQAVVPSKAPAPTQEDVDIVIRECKFLPFPFGDKKSRLLVVNFAIENNSKDTIAFSNIAVKCDHNHSYLPYCASPSFFKERAKTVAPNAVQEATITFQVGSPKLKYSLVILDRTNTNILSQVAIN